MRRLLAAGGLLAVIGVAAALTAAPASAATLPTPTNVTATAQPNGALVSFTAVSPPAGAVYTYTATASPGGMVSQAGTNGSALTELGFGNLTNGVTYTFTVTVSDGSGDSSLPSAASNAVTPELTVPGAPAVGWVHGGDQQATMSFGEDNDNDDGGSAVTKYTVTASPGGKQVTGQGSPLTVTGLTDGTSYTLAVTATNAIGTSAPGTSPAVTPLATPSVTTAPQITGDQHVGETLQVSTGAWSGSPDTFDYQWYDCSPSDPSSCNEVGGGGSEYTVQSTDIGFTLEAQVTAENADDEFATATTAPTAVVSAFSTPVATTPASLTGDPLVGDTVHADAGAWTEGPNTFAYQWYDCDPVNGTNCAPIYRGTSADYTVKPDDGGSTLEVAVTATNPANLSATSTSSPTATVTERPGAPEVTTLPTVGSVDGGEPVSGTQGSWSNSPTSFRYTWISCLPDFSTCSDDTDPSSTLAPYSPTTPDSGDVVLLEVVATNAVGDSVSALSEPSTPVAFPPPTISVVFPVTGDTYLQSQIAGVPPQVTCTPALGTQLTECADTLGSTSGDLLSTLGTDSFRVFADDDDGGRAATTVTYTVTTPSALQPFTPGSPVTPPPIGRPSFQTATPMVVITGLRQSSSRWHGGSALPETHPGAAPPRPAAGTFFSFTSSTAGDLELVFRRQQPGRRTGPLCAAPTRANRHRAPCTLLGPPGTIPIYPDAGENYVSFDGRLTGSTRLKPGSYVATVELAGTIEVLGTLRFTIVK